MKHMWRASVAMAVLIAAGVTSPVQAQMMGPYNPPISPYINIIRGGASPAVNWFNIVQPQLQFNDAIGQLAVGQANLGAGLASMAGGPSLGVTGHPVMFGNYGPYYRMGRMGGMGGMGMGMGGMGMGGMGMGMGGMGMGGMGMGGMGMGGMGMGGMGMGGMGMGGMGMGGMGMGGMGMGMGGMGMGGMGMGGMGMGMGGMNFR